MEYYDDPALDMVLEHGHGMRNPLETRAPFYMLVETSGSNADHDCPGPPGRLSALGVFL